MIVLVLVPPFLFGPGHTGSPNQVCKSSADVCCCCSPLFFFSLFLFVFCFWSSYIIMYHMNVVRYHPRVSNPSRGHHPCVMCPASCFILSSVTLVVRSFRFIFSSSKNRLCYLLSLWCPLLQLPRFSFSSTTRYHMMHTVYMNNAHYIT